MPSTKTRVNKVANVVIPVADQERALTFYVDTLGFERRVDLPFGGKYRWIEVGLPGQDTTIALAHLIFEGVLDRFPGVKFIGAHGGGFLASYIGRFDNCNTLQAPCQRMKRKPSDYLRGPQLYFDSLVYGPQNLRNVVSAAGASQIVIGTDFGFPIASMTPVDTVLQTPGLSVEEQRMILGGNAAGLLKLGT